MTYQDWTDEKLQAEIKLLEEKLEATMTLMEVEEIPVNTESINALYMGQFTLKQLRIEWKQRHGTEKT